MEPSSPSARAESAGSSAAGPRSGRGLALRPLRGLRPHVDSQRLGRLLSPPYDVIDADTRAELLARDPDNVVRVVLPEPTAAGYADAADRLEGWVRSGLFTVDERPTLYVYEMRDGAGALTRGLLGAAELRDPDENVILPHENTMAGPVADRLAVMTATGTDLEPIYLVYDGGGPASELVRSAEQENLVARALTPDGMHHRLWAVTDPAVHRNVARDLQDRYALIADGHHRYATYLERQRLAHRNGGAGPWDLGLALLVDSSEYGPQVHAIHRVVAPLELELALERLRSRARVAPISEPPDVGLRRMAAEGPHHFSAVITDGDRTFRVSDIDGELARATLRAGDPSAVAALDITVLHRGVVEAAWGLRDDIDSVGYAHSVTEAVRSARSLGGLAVLLRPTPVEAVAAVAAAGGRMPRKSTLFAPKPATGLLMRRLADQDASVS